MIKNDYLRNNYRDLAMYLTWLVVFSLSSYWLQNSSHLLTGIVLQLVILVLFLLATVSVVKARAEGLSILALLALVPVIFWLAWHIPIEFFFIYTIIWVAIIPYYMKVPHCWLVLLAVNIAWYFLRLIAWQESDAMAETLLVATFHVFALVSSLSAIEATKVSEKTQLLNRELVATQHLLGEASRDSERTRIARDLHDLLGHHLTALTINLQIASRLSEGEVQQKIEQCHALSKLLLGDVRDAVSVLRETPAVDIHTLLTLAVKDIPRLNIHLSLDEQISIEDVSFAEAILKSVQEAITNSLKHSSATDVSINLNRTEQGVSLTITDNGRGCSQVVVGNGLRGMQERVEGVGGKLDILSQPNMRLNINIPLLRTA